MKIPYALRNPEFRFYLVGCNSKIPREKKWSTKNSYRYDDPKLNAWKGNVGIVTGYGRLIVIDFDDKEYYKEIAPDRHLPWTFCVKTPGKQLYHLYYYLEDAMFAKTAIKDKDNKTLCDIQAAGGGIICPSSKINGKGYKVVSDVPVNTISIIQLQIHFDFEPTKKREWTSNNNHIGNKEDFIIAVESLKALGVKQINGYKFECPFHKMAGKGNLAVFPDGAMKCFDCCKYWSNINYFMADYRENRNSAGSKSKGLNIS